MGRSSGMTGDDAYAILHNKIGSGGGGTGTTNYNDLNNKPKINGKTLEGDNTAEYYGMISEEQGEENSGKILKVNDDGKVIPSDITVENHVIHI